MRFLGPLRTPLLALVVIGSLLALSGCSAPNARAQAIGDAWAQVRDLRDVADGSGATSPRAFARDARAGDFGQLVHLRKPGRSRLAQPPYRSGVYSVTWSSAAARLRFMVLGSGSGIVSGPTSVYLCVDVTWTRARERRVAVYQVPCPALFTERLARDDHESLLPWSALAK